MRKTALRCATAAALAALWPQSLPAATGLTPADLDANEMYKTLEDGASLTGETLAYVDSSKSSNPTFFYATGNAQVLGADAGLQISLAGIGSDCTATALLLESSLMQNHALSVRLEDLEDDEGTLTGAYAYDSLIANLSRLRIEVVSDNPESTALLLDSSGALMMDFPVELSSTDAQANPHTALSLYQTQLTVDATASITGDIAGATDSTLTLNLREGSVFTGDIEESLSAMVTLQPGSRWRPLSPFGTSYAPLTVPDRAWSFVWKTGATLDLTRMAKPITLANATVSDGAILEVRLTDDTDPSKALMTLSARPENSSSARLFVSVKDDRSAFAEQWLYDDGGDARVTPTGLTERFDDGISTYDKTPLFGSYAGGGFALTGFEVKRTGNTPVVDAFLDATTGLALAQERQLVSLSDAAFAMAGASRARSLWARGLLARDKIASNAPGLAGQKVRAKALHVGADALVEAPVFTNLHAGLAAFAADTDHRLATGQADGKAYGALAYASGINDNWRYGLALGVSKGKVDVDAQTVSITDKTGMVFAQAYLGRPFALGEAFTVEPFMKASAYRVRFKDARGAGVAFSQVKKNASLLSLGVRAGWQSTDVSLEAGLAWVRRISSGYARNAASDSAAARLALRDLTEGYGKAEVQLAWRAKDSFEVAFSVKGYKGRVVKPRVETGLASFWRF